MVNKKSDNVHPIHVQNLDGKKKEASGMQIRRVSYELYKIDWMQRMSADQIMDTVRNYYCECRNEDSDTMICKLEDWIEEYGYDGRIYSCFDEFVLSEYMDRDYMKKLLDNQEMYADYLKDLDLLNPMPRINYQIMSNKNKYGKYCPDFDAMIVNASCKEEADYIRNVKANHEKFLHTKGLEKVAGFAFRFVYVVKNSCGHYEMYQHPYGSAYSLADCLQAAERTAMTKCSKCHMSISKN